MHHQPATVKSSRSDILSMPFAELSMVEQLTDTEFAHKVLKPQTRWLDTKGRLWMVTGLFEQIVCENPLKLEPSKVELVNLSTEEMMELSVVDFRKYLFANQFKRFTQPIKPHYL